jgi:hypothetical protein
MQPPILSTHLYYKVTFFLSYHRKFYINWTSFKRTPILKDLFLLCPKGDLLIQVWLPMKLCDKSSLLHIIENILILQSVYMYFKSIDDLYSYCILKNVRVFKVYKILSWKLYVIYYKVKQYWNHVRFNRGIKPPPYIILKLFIEKFYDLFFYFIMNLSVTIRVYNKTNLKIEY